MLQYHEIKLSSNVAFFIIYTSLIIFILFKRNFKYKHCIMLLILIAYVKFRISFERSI